MFFTALLFGAGIFLYYFPDDAAKLLLPHLDKLHELGIEDNMHNKRKNNAPFDQADRWELAREYLTKGKQLFFALVGLSLFSTLVFQGLFGAVVSSVTASGGGGGFGNIQSVYGFTVDRQSVVVINGVDDATASIIDKSAVFSNAYQVYFVPNDPESVYPIQRIVSKNYEVRDHLPRYDVGTNMVLSILSTDTTEASKAGRALFRSKLQSLTTQVADLYNSVAYGMKEGKIVFAARSGEDDESVLVRAVIGAAMQKISSLTSNRIEVFVSFGDDVEKAVDGALECFEAPSTCSSQYSSSVSEDEADKSQERVLGLLAQELIFPLKSDNSANFAHRSNSDSPPPPRRERAKPRFDELDMIEDEARAYYRHQPRLGIFSGLIVALTRLMLYIYPGVQTLVAFVYSPDNEEEKTKRSLWRKYWIIFAFSVIVEDVFLKHLPYILFLPGECLKMVLLSKCMIPGPEVSGLAYDTACERIMALKTLVEQELENERRASFSNPDKVQDDKCASDKIKPTLPPKPVKTPLQYECDSDSDYPDAGEDDDYIQNSGTPMPSAVRPPTPELRRRSKRAS